MVNSATSNKDGTILVTCSADKYLLKYTNQLYLN